MRESEKWLIGEVKRLQAVEAFVRQWTERDPMDGDGDCLYCTGGQRSETVSAHDVDCPWARARKLLEGTIV